MLPPVNNLLFSRAFAARSEDPFASARARLHSAYEKFWTRGVQLSQRISSDLPDLTLYDEAHLLAVWDRAAQLAGPAYNLNPLETFILGGAILLHDTGHAFAAYQGALVAIKIQFNIKMRSQF